MVAPKKKSEEGERGKREEGGEDKGKREKERARRRKGTRTRTKRHLGSRFVATTHVVILLVSLTFPLPTDQQLIAYSHPARFKKSSFALFYDRRKKIFGE
jgi:hypothetical protein